MPIVLKGSIPRPSAIKMTDKALMREIGNAAKEAIQSRTRDGRDSSGRPFAPYSPLYAKRKSEQVGASRSPNLMLSGDMLNALQIVEVTDDTVTLGWFR